MPAKSSRPQKVGDLLHRVIAEALLREVKDPRLANVTITGVEVSGDLSVAKVHFALLGDDSPDEALKGFAKCCGFLRGHIGRSCQLRIVPNLSFHYDDTGLKAQAIEALIAKALKKQ